MKVVKLRSHVRRTAVCVIRFDTKPRHSAINVSGYLALTLSLALWVEVSLA